MPSNWTKQPQFLLSKYLNYGTGDANVGGTLTGVPSGVTANQGDQTQPGDRLIFSASDALALSFNSGTNNNGNLFGGLYQYVQTRNNSTANANVGHAAFWDLAATANNTNSSNAAQNASYQVTADNAANIGVNLLAGVYINNITSGNSWWIQAAGKATLKFLTVLSGTGAIGSAVYVATAANSNNNANAQDVGSFDVYDGANSAAIFTANSTTAYNTVNKLLNTYVGVAEVAPTNNNTAVVDMSLMRVYRW